MWVELGHLALILALAMAAAQAFFGLLGAGLDRPRWMAVVPSAVVGQFVFLAIAVGTLIHAFIENDFSVAYVAQNSNSALPLFYRVTALWGAHEGSLLLWICVLSLTPRAFRKPSRRACSGCWASSVSASCCSRLPLPIRFCARCPRCWMAAI